MRNLIYAFDRSFEMALAALAAPIVGWIAEYYFGFQVRRRLAGQQASTRVVCMVRVLPTVHAARSGQAGS